MTTTGPSTTSNPNNIVWYIDPKPSLGGAYSPPQNPGFPGAVKITDEQMRLLVAHNGFVNITVEDDVVTEMTPNLEAWEKWKASLPEPAPAQPTPQEDTEAMMVDHEYRLTLLELGVTEEV